MAAFPISKENKSESKRALTTAAWLRNAAFAERAQLPGLALVHSFSRAKKLITLLRRNSTSSFVFFPVNYLVRWIFLSLIIYLFVE